MSARCHKRTFAIPEAQVVYDLFANRRLSLLKVQMQMSSVRVVSLWAKHREKYFAAALMRETQELGFGGGRRTHTGRCI